MTRWFLCLLLIAANAGAATAQHPFTSDGTYDPGVPVPASVLGHEVGERFTPHHVLMRYLDRLAVSSSRIRVDTVAHSVEGREVVLAIVSSEENLRRMEQIRADAGRLANPAIATPSELRAIAERLPVIVWMGYTVHGPEASGAEAAIAILYQLTAGRDARTLALLDSAVILIDPLQNPDGHERHVQDVMRMRTALGVPVHPDATIHAGTWPGPRTSHYHFDLNRDWFTQSHPETRGRIEAMMRWWPHVAVDLHEMSYNASYFFPPAMDPVNRLVDSNILEWWEVFASANMRAFDARGWSFFRREGYDEFYPGYGSSWPIYTGAVGMTYEQASSRGGAIRRSDGSVLTLHEAAERHYTASWATLTAAADGGRQRVRDYLAFRLESSRGGDREAVRAIALQRDGAGRADSLVHRLLDNGVQVNRLREEVRVRGTRFGESSAGTVRLSPGTYVVNLAQPQGRLARAILEPDAPLDSAFIGEELERRRTGQSARFYDLTAWALPYTHRVTAWTLGAMPSGTSPVERASGGVTLPARAAYGYAFAPGTEAGYRMLSGLLRDSVQVWFAPRAFRSGGRDFPAGAFVVRVAGQEEGLHGRVIREAAASGADVVALSSAAAEAGTDLGSNSVFPLRAPRVAILGGSPVSGQAFGYAWFAFDNRLAYPSTRLDADVIAGSALDDFDLLVIPSTSPAALRRVLGPGGTSRIEAWVRRGGVLLTMEAASEWVGSEEVGISRLRTRPPPSPDSAGAPLRASVPGAIARVLVDPVSPLLAGIQETEFPALVFSDRVFLAPDDRRPGELAIRFAAPDDLRIAGYFWPESTGRLAGSPYLWTERVGRGRVIAFAGDPNFRDMWRGLLPVFANAVFFGPNF